MIIAAALEAACGGGMPGPLLLLALAAGLAGGLQYGLLIGAAAGLCSSLLTGAYLPVFVVVGMLTGAAASIIPRYFSRRNLLIAVGAAGCCSLLICLLWGAWFHLSLQSALLFACRRGLCNALWMFPIYGIVLVFSDERVSRYSMREY